MSDIQMTQEQVQGRVDDWGRRVQNLYNEITTWLKPIERLRVDENQNATMYEEMMQKFSISRKTMPTLDVFDGDELIARLKPIGLWIIGANGRVDLLLREGAIVLLDESEQFQEPKWMAHDKCNFRNGLELTKDFFLQLLGIEKHECV